MNRQQALVIRVGDRRVGDHWGKDLEDAYERFMRAYELTEKNCLVREVPALGSTAGIRGLLSLWPTSRWVFIVVPFVSGQTTRSHACRIKTGRIRTISVDMVITETQLTPSLVLNIPKSLRNSAHIGAKSSGEEYMAVRLSGARCEIRQEYFPNHWLSGH